MSNDFPSLGLGVGALVVALLVYVAVLLVVLWIFYLIIRAAVTHGIMRASARGAFTAVDRSAAPPQRHYPPQPPQHGPPGGYSQ